MLSWHSVGTYHENEFTRNLSGLRSLNHCGMILALKSGACMCMLISTNKKAQVGNESSNIPQESSQGKSHPQNTSHSKTYM